MLEALTYGGINITRMCPAGNPSILTCRIWPDCASGLARYLAGAAGEHEFLRYQKRRTHALVEHYWNEIELVAQALIERDQLSGPEVKDIIEAPRRLKQEDRADQQRWIEAMAAEP